SRRREVESSLRAGDVLGVVSTNALELGVDIGHLDVAVLAGYPGTIASLWQQAGRAGRRSEPSAAMLVATSAPLDQFMVTHPDYLSQGHLPGGKRAVRGPGAALPRGRGEGGLRQARERRLLHRRRERQGRVDPAALRGARSAWLCRRAG